jgi:KDEL-tailed cysteine endopeptidase
MQKTVIIALAVIGTLTAGFLLFGRQSSQPSTDAVKDVYNQWKLNFKINVGAAEDDYRFGVFSKNYGKINTHNRLLGRSYSLGLNAFTHLTQEEFAATHLGFKAPAAGAKNTVKLPLKNLKTTVDWAEKLNAVKNQGQCGSCWAFSAVGAIEGAHVALNGNLFNLAEQELVDCAGSFGNQGCNGGLMDQAFQYVASVGGLANEADYPYKAADGDCQTVKTRNGKIAAFVDVAVNSSDALKAALNKQPVAVAIEADTFTFQGYSGGVINDDSCGTQLDHGVVAVGFNDEDKIPYYKVRNSWGASWGEAGHVRLAIVDGPGMCGIQMAASYPTL